MNDLMILWNKRMIEYKNALLEYKEKLKTNPLWQFMVEFYENKIEELNRCIKEAKLYTEKSETP